MSDVGQRTQAQPRGRMMPGAEAARRLDDDQRRALGNVRRHIPRRRDDERAGADRRKRAL